MGCLVLLMFIAVPIGEIAVFIQVGDQLGLWPTLAIVVATAFIGTALLRIQGLMTLMRVREQFEAGQLPVQEVFDGLCLLVAGVLLLTPGFITDTLGFLLFLPPLRAYLRETLGRKLLEGGHVSFGTRSPGGPGHAPPPPGPDDSASGPVFDVDYVEIDDQPPKGPDRHG